MLHHSSLLAEFSTVNFLARFSVAGLDYLHLNPGEERKSLDMSLFFSDGGWVC